LDLQGFIAKNNKLTQVNLLKDDDFIPGTETDSNFYS
jgi:hypothetical protein